MFIKKETMLKNDTFDYGQIFCFLHFDLHILA